MAPNRSSPRPTVGRRATAADPLKKVNPRLHANRAKVAAAVRALIEAGEAPSADAFVEQAVIAALRERRRGRLYATYAEAATDSAFAADMDAITRAFDVAVADGLAAEG